MLLTLAFFEMSVSFCHCSTPPLLTRRIVCAPGVPPLLGLDNA
jgi:hypothetical protein